MNIFFDLDGTLLDSRQRLYQLFCKITGQVSLSFDNYWELKKKMWDNRKILSEYFDYSEDDLVGFEKKWMDQIESDEYLMLDTPFPFTREVLQTLKEKGISLHLITSRQYKSKVIDQLNKHELNEYFTAVWVTQAKQTKSELIQNSGIQLSMSDLMVGDTEIDIRTAKSLGIRSMGVLSGFRNKLSMLKSESDYIENDIRAVLNYTSNCY